MDLVKINRKLPEDGNYVVGPYNMTTEQIANLTKNAASRSQLFTFSLADTNAVTTAYADGDCLVELGAIDVTDMLGIQDGDYAATRILIKNVYTNVITATSETLVGNLRVSATSGTATNAALTSGTEVVGAGATYQNETGGDLTLTETDIDLGAVDLYVARPNIDVAIASKNLYLCTTTAVNADVTDVRGVVLVEYEVI